MPLASWGVKKTEVSVEIILESLEIRLHLRKNRKFEV